MPCIYTIIIASIHVGVTDFNCSYMSLVCFIVSLRKLLWVWWLHLLHSLVAALSLTMLLKIYTKHVHSNAPPNIWFLTNAESLKHCCFICHAVTYSVSNIVPSTFLLRFIRVLIYTYENIIFVIKSQLNYYHWIHLHLLPFMCNCTFGKLIQLQIYTHLPWNIYT